MDYPQYEKLEQVADRIDDAAQLRSRHRIRQRISSLCASCHNGFIYRTSRMNDPIVICQRLEPEREMPLDVEECSKYSAIGGVNLSALAQMAVLVEKDQKNQAGFTIPKIGGNE